METSPFDPRAPAALRKARSSYPARGSAILAVEQSDAPANVRVDVGPRVVEVRVEHPSVGTVVPVAATIQAPLWLVPIENGLLLKAFYISSQQPPDLVILFRPDLVLVNGQRRRVFSATKVFVCRHSYQLAQYGQLHVQALYC